MHLAALLSGASDAPAWLPAIVSALVPLAVAVVAYQRADKDRATSERVDTVAAALDGFNDLTNQLRADAAQLREDLAVARRREAERAAEVAHLVARTETLGRGLADCEAKHTQAQAEIIVNTAQIAELRQQVRELSERGTNEDLEP